MGQSEQLHRGVQQYRRNYTRSPPRDPEYVITIWSMANDEPVQVDAGYARRWASSVFGACGMNRDDATTVADQLVSDDLRGVLSHGLIRVRNYVQRLTTGSIDPTGEPHVVRQNGATALVDGGNAMGQVVAVHAMDTALEIATKQGTGSVAVRRSNHFGTCAHYALRAADRQMIGIATTVSAGNVMPPWGAAEPLLGNNPFGIAVPAKNHPHLVLDISFSVVAGGKVLLAAKRGEQIPPTWALGPDGLPETDAVRAAQNVVVQPLGGHKGYGLALMMAMLAAILPGAAFGRDVQSMRDDFAGAQDVGHWFSVVDPASFGDPDEFRARVDHAIDAMHSASLAVGNDRILVPGELEAQTEARQRLEGIGYPVDLVAELNEVGNELGVGPLTVDDRGDDR
jgi:LDH2 family malate/lactate/ureidoglycolate dehydrogenase